MPSAARHARASQAAGGGGALLLESILYTAPACRYSQAVIVAFCTLSYFVLEVFGLPRLSMVWITLLGWSIFNLQMLYVILRSR